MCIRDRGGGWGVVGGFTSGTTGDVTSTDTFVSCGVKLGKGTAVSPSIKATAV